MFAGRPEIDFTIAETVDAAVTRHEPHLVINAAAWTAVDLAERLSSTAFELNAEGPKRLAAACRRAGIPLIHLSTDYVFDGMARLPYAVDHPVAPLNVYGASKAAGEAAVRDILDQHVILRLAWLHSEAGGNFVATILGLAEKRQTLEVVDDQTGSPTFAHDVALAIDHIVGKILAKEPVDVWGTYHLTNAGQTTWRGLAAAILDEASRFGHPKPVVRAISSLDYQTAAPRPAYSVLDTSLTKKRFGITLPGWKDAVVRNIAARFAARQPDLQALTP
jgi:dTDP-4-dehydrorhamnose reductase